MTVESARRRLRANIEIVGVPSSWEDRFVGMDAPTLVPGNVQVEGSKPCGRCVVPQHDPDSSDRIPDFNSWVVRKLRETFPELAGDWVFNNYYRMMIITEIHHAEHAGPLRVGDTVTVLE